MSWRLKVVHTTRFAYATAAHASYNEARLTPPTLPSQTTLESRIEIEPAARSTATTITGAPRSRLSTSTTNTQSSR